MTAARRSPDDDRCATAFGQMVLRLAGRPASRVPRSDAAPDRSTAAASRGLLGAVPGAASGGDVPLVADALADLDAFASGAPVAFRLLADSDARVALGAVALAADAAATVPGGSRGLRSALAEVVAAAAGREARARRERLRSAVILVVGRPGPEALVAARLARLVRTRAKLLAFHEAPSAADCTLFDAWGSNGDITRQVVELVRVALPDGDLREGTAAASPPDRGREPDVLDRAIAEHLDEVVRGLTVVAGAGRGTVERRCSAAVEVELLTLALAESVGLDPLAPRLGDDLAARWDGA